MTRRPDADDPPSWWPSVRNLAAVLLVGACSWLAWRCAAAGYAWPAAASIAFALGGLAGLYPDKPEK